MNQELVKKLAIATAVVALMSGLSATSLYKVAQSPEFLAGFLLLAVVVAIFVVLETKLAIAFLVKTLAVALFLISFGGLAAAILFPQLFSNPWLGGEELEKARELQVFAAVTFSGMMGGLMKHLSVEAVAHNGEIDLWQLVHSAITGLFVSVVFFLILRAGIINQAQIDTFNVWGVAGVAAVTGFFADRVLERFSSIYNEVVGKPKDES